MQQNVMFTLIEKEERLGGQLLIATNLPINKK
jgi:hypothetical protein